MGAMCNGSGCGGPTEEALKELNKKGVYTPKQISTQIGTTWDEVNTNGDKKVSKKDLQKICTTAINTLGRNGGGDKFKAKQFNSILNDDYADKEEFDKKSSIKIVT